MKETMEALARDIEETLKRDESRLKRERRALLVRGKLSPRKPQQAPGGLFEQQPPLLFSEEEGGRGK